MLIKIFKILYIKSDATTGVYPFLNPPSKPSKLVSKSDAAGIHEHVPSECTNAKSKLGVLQSHVATLMPICGISTRNESECLNSIPISKFLHASNEQPVASAIYEHIIRLPKSSSHKIF